MNKSTKKGFTLLELLIVIGILAILATTTVLVLNPAELLRQARDSQRISDVQTINSALSLYVTTASGPKLSYTGSGCGTYTFGYTLASGTMGATCGPTGVSSTTASRNINGTGWLPVDISGIPGGSPLAAYPVDPTNASGTGPMATSSLIYFYRCDQANLTWEINTNFESSKYNVTDDVPNKDGGTCIDTYEIGTDPGLNL